ncbi:MAG TPA: hypothetical protein DEO71_00675 [Chryseobacterium sp.]|nr:hypothetical protein [Chryseobacterium sp.]
MGEKYSSLKKPSEYNLYLKKDSTFSFSIGFGGSLIAKCKGKWEYNKTKDSLKLYCGKETPLESMTNTYISDKINAFKITRKGKILKYGKII